MITRLGIMRHGSASLRAPSDALRPLTEFGEDEVHRAVRQLQFEPQHILHSQLLRAEQTAKIVHSYYPLAGIECVDYLVPEADPREVFKALETIKHQHVLLISHQPLVAGLVSLCKDGTTRYFHDNTFLNPANFVEFDFEVFASGCATLANTYL